MTDSQNQEIWLIGMRSWSGIQNEIMKCLTAAWMKKTNTWLYRCFLLGMKSQDFLYVFGRLTGRKWRKKKRSQNGRCDGSRAVPMCKSANKNRICETFTSQNKSSDRFFFLWHLQGRKTFYLQRMPPTGEDEERHYQLCATVSSHLWHGTKGVTDFWLAYRQ